MSGVVLYGYSKCSSCRDAAALIVASGVPLSTRDLFAQPLSPDEIRSLFARIDVTPRAMLAVRSRPYRDLDLGSHELSDEMVIDLMSRYPALVRRPIVVAETGSHVGFNRAALARLLATVREGWNGDA